MRVIHLKKGQEICKEGGSGNCAYIIESGSVEVSKSMGPGEKQVLVTLHELDIFGELGLIDGLPRSATVTALENCTVSVLTQEAFTSMSKRTPQALMPIIEILVKRLRMALKVLNDLDAKAD